MSPIRVAIDVTSLLGPPTGIHQATRGLIDALVDRDDVDVRGWLLTARGDRPDVSVPVRRSRTPAALAVRGWARGNLPPGRFVTGRADVVHGTNFLAPPTPRSVISLQDMTPINHPEWCETSVAAMAAPLRRAIERGATLHVSSDLVRREAIEEFGIAPGRVRLVHHAIRPLVGGDPASGRALAGSDRYVAVLGTVERRKNVAAVVEVMHQLPADVRLVIMGPAGNAEAAVVAAAEQLGDRAVRLRSVDSETRNSLIRGATVLAWPSHYEGFAMPPLEALSVGTPIVATAVGALPELVGDTIPLVAGGHGAFAEALVSAVESPTEVPAAIIDRIAGLTWKRAASAMVEIYEDVHRQAGGEPASR